MGLGDGKRCSKEYMSDLSDLSDGLDMESREEVGEQEVALLTEVLLG